MAVLLNRLREFDRARLPPLRQPALETTGAAPLRYGGRGYGNSAARSLGLPDGPGGGMRIPDGVTMDQVNNVVQATAAREQLQPRLQQIATIQPDSPLPTIQGADYTRLKQTEGAILASARPQLDPANVRQAFSPQNDPLAEKKAAEAAMGGRTIEDVVKSMERRTPRGTLESAARLDERDLRMADANRNAAADRRATLDLADRRGAAEINKAVAEGRAALDVETRKGRTALDIETRKGINDANNLRAGIDAQRQDDLIRRELKIERPALPSRDAAADAYLDGVRRGASAALRPPAAADAGATPGNYPENAANPAAAPVDPDEGKIFMQNGVRYIKRNGQYVRA